MSSAVASTNKDKDQMHAQYGPKLVTSLPGPKAQAAVAADERLISPSYTRSYPLVAKRGRGIRVEDVDGNEFLDFAAGIAVALPATAILRWLRPFKSRQRS